MKFVIQKVNYRRKLKIEDFKKRKFQFRGSELIFEATSKTKMTFKNILDYSAVIPTQFPFIKIESLMNIDQN